MKTLKYSRQRESIKACLMGRKDHPTADALYTSIREQFPNISLGTVYRNLNLLVELGEIRKLSCGDGTDHFDYDTSPTTTMCVKSAEKSWTWPWKLIQAWKLRPGSARRELLRNTPFSFMEPAATACRKNPINLQIYIYFIK